MRSSFRTMKPFHAYRECALYFYVWWSRHVDFTTGMSIAVVRRLNTPRTHWSHKHFKTSLHPFINGKILQILFEVSFFPFCSLVSDCNITMTLTLPIYTSIVEIRRIKKQIIYFSSQLICTIRIDIELPEEKNINRLNLLTSSHFLFLMLFIVCFSLRGFSLLWKLRD